MRYRSAEAVILSIRLRVVRGSADHYQDHPFPFSASSSAMAPASSDMRRLSEDAESSASSDVTPYKKDLLALH